MKIRSSKISVSISRAISEAHRRTPKKNIVKQILSFFAFFRLFLTRYRPTDFLSLRNEWHLDEDEYVDSFQPPALESQLESGNSRNGKGHESELVPVGDLGYSGSTFFTTPNSRYLIKSLPRRFEHRFFTHDLFDAYVAHMKAHPDSLLVRITDMVYTPHATLGGIIGTAPTHHIVMENLLYGKDLDGEGAAEKWETYDLKPDDYFFPERDIAGGKLAPESVKDRLIAVFPGKVRVSAQEKQELMSILSADTALLASNNTVDYSLFLVRFPGPNARSAPSSTVPALKSVSHPWRTGVDDVDGEWTYRVVVLDFFWAKHKFRARAMTGLVKGFDLIARKGPMSITAEPGEYRDRFLGMVDGMVLAVDG